MENETEIENPSHSSLSIKATKLKNTHDDLVNKKIMGDDMVISLKAALKKDMPSFGKEIDQIISNAIAKINVNDKFNFNDKDIPSQKKFMNDLNEFIKPGVFELLSKTFKEKLDAYVDLKKHKHHIGKILKEYESLQQTTACPNFSIQYLQDFFEKKFFDKSMIILFDSDLVKLIIKPKNKAQIRRQIRKELLDTNMDQLIGKEIYLYKQIKNNAYATVYEQLEKTGILESCGDMVKLANFKDDNKKTMSKISVTYNTYNTSNKAISKYILDPIISISKGFYKINVRGNGNNESQINQRSLFNYFSYKNLSIPQALLSPTIKRQGNRMNLNSIQIENTKTRTKKIHRN